MENNNLTTYQKLFVMFGGGSNKPTPTTKYTFDQNDTITTTSVEEYNKQKLQLQQQKYTENQWGRVDSELFQKAMYYETSRIASYMDFEAMEFFPEISAAMDLYAEESTTMSEMGEILTIRSESKRIKTVLKDLFYKILDVQTNLPMWTRNVCKYGDNFVYLKVDSNNGVVGCSQLTNIEIERKEPTMWGDQASDKGKKQVKFIWREKNMEFNPWEVAHFRLLGDDRKLPYGTSMLEKTRRIWKMLLLAEDAMLVYRVVRAPERRVFKVYVGNIDDKDVEAYVQKVANKFKRTQTVDQKTGQVDLRMNTLAIDQDYFIPVRDTNQANPIETLAGASNLDQIADLEYIQKKLLTSLRIPKSFLGFDEAAGDGKNLALQDVRFARTINRIQQSVIQELNKIAIIHLYILGFQDDLDNFTLSLTNPSTQGEMLKIEQWKEKVLLYKDLTSQVEGIAPTSHTWAKRNIFNFSDDEIRTDLEQQRIERAVVAELEKTPEIIKTTGFFKNIDNLYGDLDAIRKSKKGGDGGDTGTSEPEGGDDFSGGGGSFSSSGGGLDFGGGDEFGSDTDLGGVEGEELGGEPDLTGGDTGTEEIPGGETPPSELAESKIEKLLLEGIKKNEMIKSMTDGIDELINKED